MNQNDLEYHKLLEHILKNGKKREDRTGVGTTSVFGYSAKYDLNAGFPLITTKKVFWKGVVGELLWMLSGSTNNNVLNKKYGVSIWNEWAGPRGELGPIYGAQWRSWVGYNNTIDQIDNVISSIKKNPNSRRHMVVAYNPADVPDMALPPCHAMFQFYVSDGKLSCCLYQRSGDAFLGVPFNIASYALLTHMIAQVTGLGVGEFIHHFGDLHIYNNHLDQVKEQLSREAKNMPTLLLNPDIKDIDNFQMSDIKIEGYDPHPVIKGEVAI